MKRNLVFWAVLVILTGIFVVSADVRAASPGDVIFSEIAWMGTNLNSTYEWIELYNTTDTDINIYEWSIENASGLLLISLGPWPVQVGYEHDHFIIPAKGFYILERYSDLCPICDREAETVYPDYLNLVDTGDTLLLKDNLSNVIDYANQDGGAWPAGSDGGAGARYTMERTNPAVPEQDTYWTTNNGIDINGHSRPSPIDPSCTEPIFGTPGANAFLTGPGPSVPPEESPYNLCLDFDGIDDHVQVDDAATLDLAAQGTLESWVYMFATADNAGIIHKGDGATGEAYSLRFGAGAQKDQIVLQINDGISAQSITSSTRLVTGRWYHVAGTWANGGSMTIYINGWQDQSGACTVSAQNSAQKLILGARYDTGADALEGRLDSVRVWNDVRSESEIRDYMCRKWTGTDANLRGCWLFDELSGTECIDKSGNTNAGQMTDMDPPSDRICSSAPIGDASLWDYTGTAPGDFTLNLASADGDDMTITGDGGTWDDSTAPESGLHLYRVDQAPNAAGAPFGWQSFARAPRYWGVFTTGGTNPTYTMEYNYDGYPNIIDEASLGQAYRFHNCDSWKNLQADLDTVANTLTKTGLSGTEFILGFYVDPRNAILYDGVDDYVGVPDENSLDLADTGTLEAWIYPASFATGAGIVFKDTGSICYGFGLGGDAAGVFTGGGNTNIGFAVGDSGGAGYYLLTGATNLLVDKWYHVACVWDTGPAAGASNMFIYINGVPEASQDTSPMNPARIGAGELRFGMQNVSSVYFDGRIDEVRIWNTARTQTQIRDAMCRKLAGSEGGLAGNWRFDEETTSAAIPDYDFGTANDGTMYNFGTAGDIIAARVCSGAPIGDDSSWDYPPSPVSAQVAHSDGDYFFATENGGTWNNTFSGLHVYRVDGPPVYPPDINGPLPYDPYTTPNGLTPPSGWSSIDYYRYWGVFLTDWLTAPAEPQYQAVYYYGTPGNGNPSVPSDENVIALAKRDSYCDRTWADAAAALNSGANTLTRSGETQNSPSKTYTEYVLAGRDDPLAIAMASFTAEIAEDIQCVVISWETATEMDTLGFQLWRSDCRDGAYTLVPSSYTRSESVLATQGARYSFTDCGVVLDGRTNYYYKLEEIDLDNLNANPFYGPVGPVPDAVSASQQAGAGASKGSEACFISTVAQ